MSRSMTERYVVTDIPHRIVYAYLDEPPFGAPGPDGGAIGYDAELAENVLHAVGVTHIDVVLVKFPDLIGGVMSGRWTMNTGMFVTPERSQSVAFSRPIWALVDGFVVKAGNPKGLRSYADAARDPSVKLAGVRGNVQVDSAFKAGVPAERMRLFESQHDIIAEIRSGRIDAYPGAALAHRGFIEATGADGVEVVQLESQAGTAPLGAFSYAKESRALKDAVDAYLAEYLGTDQHLALAKKYGLTMEEISPVIAPPSPGH
ncbi:transporter substrate-binding domain-containing protein [Labrys monachus]|uniref:Polar amino acid transport system substrate-binding protein n=1 Tax=Labrys monachus TaxID=217067 RepID=A0ABU0FEK9_9HYPH|nr:transporter substrate-binding domain-containing protein [Labrys monachus]MDQ0393049.1 polar amino acid transport system substrate-binding protein [Labrys monachus]